MGKDGGGLASLFGGGGGQQLSPGTGYGMSGMDGQSVAVPYGMGSGTLPGQTTGVNAGGINWSSVGSALGSGASSYAANQSNQAGVPALQRANNAAFKAQSLMPGGDATSYEPPTQLQQISTPAEGTMDRVQKSLGYRAIPPTTYRPIPLVSEAGKVFRAKRYRT